jgi:oligogalacturonide transport system substrate-binding protein
MFNDDEAIAILQDCRSVPPTEKARALLNDQGLLNKVVVDSVNLAMEDGGNRESVLSSNSEVVAVIDTVFQKLIYKQYDATAAAEEAFVLWEDILANLKANA